MFKSFSYKFIFVFDLNIISISIIMSNIFYKVKYGLEKELELLLKINNLLNEAYILTKTADKYCCVDYIFSSKSDNIICYIELKSRKNISHFDDLMIGCCKLKNISLLKYKTILLWVDGDMFYYCDFNKKMLEYPTGIICGSSVLYIPKTDMTTGDLNTFTEMLNNF